MGLRDIFRLEESTVRAGRRIYNFLIRAVSYGIAIVILGGVSVGLNFCLDMPLGPWTLMKNADPYQGWFGDVFRSISCSSFAVRDR